VSGPFDTMRRRGRGARSIVAAALLATGLAAAGVATATPVEPSPPASPATTETIDQALCRLVDSAARRHDIPTAFLTRLIWRESSFRPRVTSPAGALGIAQFMPQTAADRGLADPFDPEQAIPEAAALIKDLAGRFGNLGLAAAAYNGGPARVANWLQGRGELPAETRSYVLLITDRSVDEWAAEASNAAQNGPSKPPADDKAEPPQSCLQVTAALRRPGRDVPTTEAPLAPWGVQLAGNFSKERALTAFARARQSYAAVLGEVRPMIIGTRLRSRGTRAFYRVRVPAATRQAANQLCQKIRAVGGACIVLPS
jgi:Transglycosylase SLT domain/SPOR domain